MRASSTSLPGGLLRSGVVGAGVLTAQALWVMAGGDPFLPRIPAWLLAGWAVLGPLSLLRHAEATARTLAILALLAVAAHLSMLDHSALYPPTNGDELRSLFAGEMSRTTRGFPFRALVALFGAVSYAGTILFLFPTQSSRWPLALTFGCVHSAWVIHYATGSLALLQS